MAAIITRAIEKVLFYMKRWLNIGLGVAFSIGALLLALNGVPLDQVGGQLANGNYFWLIPCIVLSLIGLALRAVRWRELLNNRITLGHSYNILNVGYFLNAILPARLGEVARTYLATRLNPPIPVFTTLSTIVVERLIDTLTVVFLILIGLALTPNVDPTVRRAAFGSGIVAVFGLVVLIVLAARRSWAHALVRFGERLIPPVKRINPAQLMDKVLDGVQPLTSPRGAITTIFWTGIAWAFSVVAAYFLLPTFFSLDHPGNWTAAILMVAFASLAIAFPAVPGSIGLFEFAVTLALQAAGLVREGDVDANARAVAFAVVLHACNVFCYVSTGYLGLIREKISIGQIMESARNLTRRKSAEPVPQP
jgi:glycosyltransferase 2 family protein